MKDLFCEIRFFCKLDIYLVQMFVENFIEQEILCLMYYKLKKVLIYRFLLCLFFLIKELLVNVINVFLLIIMID